MGVWGAFGAKDFAILLQMFTILIRRSVLDTRQRVEVSFEEKCKTKDGLSIMARACHLCVLSLEEACFHWKAWPEKQNQLQANLKRREKDTGRRTEYIVAGKTRPET